ncbi:DUF3290 family protein [Apilactobacillus ozensis]|uniref:Membrane protein yetF n=1 Tax=Apilactobacillus ozensis DSM 23829 = JCM 17196 TaxID=1423781 RepID=A0A0R2ATL6_9LACO|nr:DUF3290 family protein [Apilactobacillus ozensis]KRM69946.1 hypothetical protein FD06_GL000113 [Apilactobacillus ozensis DSM 23829 = JCM 17196]MCK8606836.1 DUF3290 family protein [Apilactobacillus ozensis]
MNLYSYEYLNNSNAYVAYLLLLFALILGITIIFNGIKYMRDRTNLKYRDFFVMLTLISILAISMVFSHVMDQKATSSRNNQTVKMIQDISKNKKVSVNKIYTSSTNLSNGMTVKVDKQYYEVNLNANLNSYTLTPIRLIDNNFNYVTNSSSIISRISNYQYLTIALKLIIGFIVLVLQINLSGKGNLAPSNAIDQLQNYVLGGIIGGMIYSQDVSILQFFIVLLIWSIIVFGSKILNRQSAFFRKIFTGSPQVVIQNGIINVDTALRSGLSASDLTFKLRTQGVSNFKDVKSATLEQNGQLTITTFGTESVNYPVITDGSINEDVVKRMGKTPEWLEQMLEDEGKDISQIYLGQYVHDNLMIISFPSHSKRPWYYYLKYQNIKNSYNNRKK